MFWNQFGNFIGLDPDPELAPDSSDFVDPDTVNPDPDHCIKGAIRIRTTKNMTLQITISTIISTLRILDFRVLYDLSSLI